MSYVIEVANLIGELLFKDEKHMVPLTKEETCTFKPTTHCEICNSLLIALHRRVRDHCHLTGQFRSVLCSDYNLKRQNQDYLPIFIDGSSN